MITHKQLASLLTGLLLTLTLALNSQTCAAGFVYTLSPNGTATFSNTSVQSGTGTVTYSWSFGNNVSFTTNLVSQTVSATYTSNGSYSVLLSMQGPTPNCSSAFQQIFTVSIPGCGLSAATGTFPATGASTVPTVSFTNASTGTTSSTTYTWNFGDGNTSNQPNPIHTYTGNGLYGYTLTASDSPTCHSHRYVSLGEAYGGPTYICAYIPSITYTVGAAGQVDLKVNGSSGTYGFYTWKFGDNWVYPGGNASQYSNTITHVYYNGAYTPSVWIAIGTSCIYTPTTSLTITNNACTSSPAFSYTMGSSGSVQFSKTAPPSSTNEAHLWYFGDGSTSMLSNPSHTYASAGNYSVGLRTYITSYSIAGISDTNFVSGPCRTYNSTSVSITGIPCLANSNFTIYPSGPQTYIIFPAFPYNFSNVLWDWGDNSTSNTLYASHTYSASGTYDLCLTVTATCGSTATTCFSQYLAKGTAGANMVQVDVLQPALSNAIIENVMEPITSALFPNPTNGRLNIRLNMGRIVSEISIFDLVGKQVYYDDKRHDSDIRIDLDGLPDGLYYTRLRSGQQVETSKFIISR